MGCITTTDDGRDAELTGDDRGMAGTPAAVGHDRARDLHDRLPVGIGDIGHQHLTGLQLVHVLGICDHPCRARGNLGADAATADPNVATGIQLERLLDRARLH